ncbi:adenylate/guanylate cyclase domain-containing protein [Desulfococcus sp.]|uniref:adenylate/guanylate cyclase domain-containing protein n=1 Tax=Desulfococcus sp. TaxID=2025834 RepID=UPI003593369F
MKRSRNEAQRPLFGHILMQKNIITEAQLQQALDIQRTRRAQLTDPTHIGQVLVQLGYAAEKDVLQAINEYHSLAVKSLSENLHEQVESRCQKPGKGVFIPRVPIWLQWSLITTGLITVTVFTLYLFTIDLQNKQLFRQTLLIGKVSLNYFVSNARILLLEEKNDLMLNTLLTEASAVEGIVYAIILDQNRIIKAHTDHTRIGETFDMESLTTSGIKEDTFTYFDYFSATGEHILNLSRTVVMKEKALGEVHVGISLDFIDLSIREKNRHILIISLAIIGLGLVIAVFYSIRFSRPLTILVRAFGEISAGNYQHRIQDTRKDEFGNLAKSFNSMSRELWLKSMMERSFGKYVGTEVLELILNNPASDWLKGKRRSATVLFTDVRGFTSYSEPREPEEIVERLNEYFEIATEAINRHGGYVDKFVGDAVMGVFGVPFPCDDHVERAVRAAMSMQQTFQEKSRSRKNGFLGRIGIGINSGMVLSGNIGSQMKMEYTVIGDTVNVASRLNGLAGPGEVIISRAIYEPMKAILEVAPLEPQNIKGKLYPVEAFRVLHLSGEE